MPATTIETTFGQGATGAALEQLCVDTIRALSMDGVEAAKPRPRTWQLVPLY